MNLELMKQNLEKYIEKHSEVFNSDSLENLIKERAQFMSLIMTAIISTLEKEGVSKEALKFVEEAVMDFLDTAKESVIIALLNSWTKEGDDSE